MYACVCVCMVYIWYLYHVQLKSHVRMRVVMFIPVFIHPTICVYIWTLVSSHSRIAKNRTQAIIVLSGLIFPHGWGDCGR